MDSAARNSAIRSYSLANLFLFVTACALFALLARGVVNEIRSRGIGGGPNVVARRAFLRTPEYTISIRLGSLVGAGLAFFIARGFAARRLIVALAMIVGWFVGGFAALQLYNLFLTPRTMTSVHVPAQHVDESVMAVFAAVGSLIGLVVGLAAAWQGVSQLHLLPVGAIAGLAAGLLAGAQLCAPASLTVVTTISILLVVMAFFVNQTSQPAEPSVGNAGSGAD